MLEYKKRILLKEFSFLAKVLEVNKLTIDQIDWINIKKCDENLLAMSGEINESYWPYSRSGQDIRLRAEKYFAINGEEIYEIPSNSKYSAEFGSGKHNADTIGEELLKKNLDPDFIVFIFFDEDSDRGADECDEHGITIYKATSFDMIEYHAYQFRRAAQALETEIRATEEK